MYTRGPWARRWMTAAVCAVTLAVAGGMLVTAPGGQSAGQTTAYLSGLDVYKRQGNGCALTEKSSWFEIVMNNWVGRALNIAISALLITCLLYTSRCV